MKKKIRLGIIGCGGFVRYHVNAIHDHVPEFRFVGLADSKVARAEKLAADLSPKHKAAAYADYARMLKEVKPEAVIVSTPHTLHFRHAYDAIRAGAHVMVEKPMVTNADDARRLVKHAKAKKRALNIAIQGTHTDTFAYARKLIADGTVGPLQLVTGVLAQGWLDLTRGWWRQDPRLSGGGQLYDSGAHVLSAMMFLVDSPVVEAFCYTDNKGTRVDINAVAAIRFANGCMASITSGGNCNAWKSLLIIQAKEAAIEISAHGGDFLAYGAAFPKPVRGVPKGWRTPTVSPARNFADVILGRAKPRCGGRMGILLADLMDALYKSARTHRPAKVTRRMPKE
jgi:predicted dehydrogenase